MNFFANITETIYSTPLIRLNSAAHRLVEETPNAFLENQYHNSVNPQRHNDFTGPEIWQQTIYLLWTASSRLVIETAS
jgi:cysteine synthase